MIEILLLKDKVKDFKEDGKCEVNSLEHANLILQILSEEYNGFDMRYRTCPFGEYWIFTKN